MATIACLCLTCGIPFYVKDNEKGENPLSLLVTMKPAKKVPAELKTWGDWVRHTSMYCEEHRLPEPPVACVLDLHALVEDHKAAFPDEDDPRVLESNKRTEDFN